MPALILCGRLSFVRLAAAATAAILVSCGGGGGGGGGGGSGVAVGGTVSGLVATTQVVLQSGSDRLVVTGNVTFQFPTAVAEGGAYAVTVVAQPAGAVCTASNSSGTARTSSPVQVFIACLPNQYTVEVQATGLVPADRALPGLTGTGLVLRNNGADDLAVSFDGALAFAATVASGGSYAIAVVQQPVGRTCTVSPASGTVTADTVRASVSCSPIVDSSPFHLYVSDGSGLLSTYAVDGATGLPGAVLGVTRASSPPVFGANGRFVYSASFQSQVIETSRVNPANGALEWVGRVAVSGNPSDLAVDPTGRFLYSTTHFSNIGDSPAFYRLDQDAGTPALPTLAINAFTSAGPFQGGRYAPEPSGRIVYRLQSRPVAFVLNADALSWSGNGSPIANFTNADAIQPLQAENNLVFHPNGRFAYATTSAGGIAAYAPDLASGALTRVPGSPFAAGSAYGTVVIDPTATFAYTASSDTRGLINGYRLNPTTGVLTPLAGSPFVFGSGRTVSLTFDPAGRYLYATTSTFGSPIADGVLQLTVDPLTGVPRALPGAVLALVGVTTSSTDNALKMAPDGRFAYLLSANGGPNAGYLAVLAVDPSSGALRVQTVLLSGAIGLRIR